MLAAGDGQHEARRALERLFGMYWFPLYSHLRARGRPHHEAEDLVQAFFVHVSEKQSLTRADRFKGSFRGFMLGCLRYFLANEREYANAYKRGGHIRMVSIDLEDAESHVPVDAGLDPAVDVERDFDRRWALLLMERALAQLREAHATRPQLFDRLRGYLTASDDTQYESAARDLDVSVAMVKTTVHRMRRQFRDLLRREITITVSAPHEVDEELRHLIHVLASD